MRRGRYHRSAARTDCACCSPPCPVFHLPFRVPHPDFPAGLLALDEPTTPVRSGSTGRGWPLRPSMRASPTDGNHRRHRPRSQTGSKGMDTRASMKRFRGCCGSASSLGSSPTVTRARSPQFAVTPTLRGLCRLGRVLIVERDRRASAIPAAPARRLFRCGSDPDLARGSSWSVSAAESMPPRVGRPARHGTQSRG